MIGRIAGQLIHRGLDHVMIDVGGLGYVVYCTDRTLAELPELGESVTLFTELLVREDLLQLYGFTSLVEKEWHRLLIGVQGIGAKASMSILSALGPDGVARAISLGDWNTIKSAKGVGPKTAQKVVLELKDKAPGVISMGASLPQAMGEASAISVIESSSEAEALSALTNLGYAPGDAAAAIAEAHSDGVKETSDLIREALKRLAPTG